MDQLNVWTLVYVDLRSWQVKCFQDMLAVEIGPLHVIKLFR